MSKVLEHRLKHIIQEDKLMIAILKIVRDINLKDCWVGAGFIRNKIWDIEHGFKRSKVNDIDIVFYDKSVQGKTHDLLVEEKLKKINPLFVWSVKNQSRMHKRNHHAQYKNCYEAISFWPETATAIGVRLNFENQIEYIAPYGLHDLFGLIVRPTPNFDLNVLELRIKQKKWKDKWHKLKIELSNNNFETVYS